MKWTCKKCDTSGQGPFLPAICIACGELLLGAVQHHRQKNRQGSFGICRECGCSQLDACFDEEFGACWWIEPDLCSHCVMKLPSAICERPSDRLAMGGQP